ncbi:MAG: histidine phosphatase family protein [Bdellovibrionota bacterium]
MSVKYIHLVRHGQYVMEKNSKKYGKLTSLGRQQARHVAKRIGDYKIDKIHVSTMKRAQETASIILKKINIPQKFDCKLLEEGIPPVHDSYLEKNKYPKYKMLQAKARMNKAFKKYFTPNKLNNETHELIVCHGNVIRYFIVKSLKLDLTKWTEFDILQCSFTTIEIRKNGRCILKCYGEIGYIPIERRTFL